jgi:muramoyltetrapeptide carboxypeptidase
MHLVKPPRLNFGDTIAIVSPASPPPDPRNIDLAAEALERLGFHPKLASNVRKRSGFLAGSDRERAADLMKMFADPAVNGILCMRGGYGSARLLPLLDYRLVRSHPKVFVGFSDITSLHSAFLVNAGLVSFHGPMLNSHFIKPDSQEFTRQSFLRTVMNPEAPGSIRQGYTGKPAQAVRQGTASGPLVGGNLSILCASIGTPWQPTLKNAILFFEDVGEAPYRFDRLLTHLLNAGLLQQVAGIAIGINQNCLDPLAAKTKEYRQTLDEVISERLRPLKIPILSGLPFGHVPVHATIPVGARATLDTRSGDLFITEGVVK